MKKISLIALSIALLLLTGCGTLKFEANTMAIFSDAA